MIVFRIGRLAEILGVHRNTITNWIRSGELPAASMIGKKYVIERENLTRFLVSKGIAGPDIRNLVEQLTEIPPMKVKQQTETQVIQKEVPMSDRPVGSVMVVGGGIAGIQASLDLADSGYRVYLLEKSPGIGGGMARLDKTFPTNDCAM